MAGELLDPLSAAGIAQAAVARALAAQRGAEGSASAAGASATDAAASLAGVKAAFAGAGVNIRWSGPNGTVLQVLLKDGTYSAGVDLASTVPGPVGKTPNIQPGRTFVGEAGWSRQSGSPDEAPVFDLTLPAPIAGAGGWTPVPAFVADGARRVLEIVDWTGGTGTKPAAGLYVGTAGLVSDLASAVDLSPPALGGTVVHTGSPAIGHVAVFGADGDHIGDGGALSPFGAGLIAASTAAAVKALLALSVADVAGAAPLASPALMGTPTAPNPAAGDASTKLATTAFVSSAIAALINAAPAALDTLGEIAAQLANDESGVSALTNTVAGKLAKASNLSDLANAATARTNLGVAIGSNVQAWDADLDAIATLATTAFGRGLLTQASATTLKALLAIAAGDVSGLGGAATKNVGTTSGTVAAGDDSRFTAGGSAAPSAINPQALPYTAVAADKGKQLVLTGTGALSFPAACQTAGWWCWVKKADGNGQAVLTPTSTGTAPTIEGLPSICMYQESYVVWWDSANSVFRTAGRPKGIVNMGSTTVASATLAINITLGFNDPELRDMLLDGQNLVPSAADYGILRVQKSGTYQTSGYNIAVTYAGTSSSPNNAGVSTSLPLAYQVSTATASFKAALMAFASPANQTLESDAVNATPLTSQARGFHTGVSAAITGVQLSMSGGANINAGAIINQKGVRP